MKRIRLLTLTFVLFSFSAYAQTRFLTPANSVVESDAINLANFLLMPSTQKCLTGAGFPGVSRELRARKAMIEENGDTTTYTITIDEYGSSGRGSLKNVKDLTIAATHKLTQSGAEIEIHCSFDEIADEK